MSSSRAVHGLLLAPPSAPSHGRRLLPLLASATPRRAGCSWPQSLLAASAAPVAEPAAPRRRHPADSPPSTRLPLSLCSPSRPACRASPWFCLEAPAAPRCRLTEPSRPRPVEGRSSCRPITLGQRFASPRLDDASLCFSSSGRQNGLRVSVFRWSVFLIRKTTVRYSFCVWVALLESVLGKLLRLQELREENEKKKIQFKVESSTNHFNILGSKFRPNSVP